MSTAFKVEFDPGGIETLMEMWREAPELTLAKEDEFNFKKIDTKLELLKTYQRSAEGWNMLILCMKPVDDKLALNLLRQKVIAFENWAKEEMQGLQILRDELKFLYQDNKR